MSFNIAHDPLPLRELLVAERGGQCEGDRVQASGHMHACICVHMCMCACSVYMCALDAHTCNRMCVCVFMHACM